MAISLLLLSIEQNLVILIYPHLTQRETGSEVLSWDTCAYQKLYHWVKHTVFLQKAISSHLDSYNISLLKWPYFKWTSVTTSSKTTLLSLSDLLFSFIFLHSNLQLSKITLHFYFHQSLPQPKYKLHTNREFMFHSLLHCQNLLVAQ